MQFARIRDVRTCLMVVLKLYSRKAFSSSFGNDRVMGCRPISDALTEAAKRFEGFVLFDRPSFVIAGFPADCNTRFHKPQKPGQRRPGMAVKSLITYRNCMYNT